MRVLAVVATVGVVAFAAACGPTGKTAKHPKLGPLSPAQIAEKALPSVVRIETILASGQGVATGFVIWKDGRIATNYHVVAGVRAAQVTLQDKRVFTDVEVMSADPKHDLAIIRIPANDLPVLALGDSDAVKAGESVVAIGNPLGLGDTVSNGLVSGLRDFSDDVKVMQISAPISPGSSGGPVFNDRGEVIGVAVGFLQQGQNLSFGVPVNYLEPMLLDELREPIAKFGAHTVNPEEAEQQDSHVAPDLPKVTRHVPHHEEKILDDCPNDQLEVIVNKIGEAISIGAPLYNEKKFGACYGIYEGAALALDKNVSKCTGAKKALADGLTNAAAVKTDYEKAWAMRDAFDGLLDVIARKLKINGAP